MEAGNAFYLGEELLRLLPRSPFASFISQFAELPFLGILNWFVPVRGILTVLAAWLAAITLFYVYSIIMRWIRMIGD